MKSIKLFGVKQNNLKNLDLEIPSRSFSVICGPSGSGKSSLAFETLFAEGQRRYLESLSNYAKQFVGQASKPLVDRVENIYPSIALEQKNPIKSSRSTVGTHSEIYDYLRVLFARLGKIYCPEHKTLMKNYDASSSSKEILSSMENMRVYIHTPLKWKTKDEGKSLRAELLKLGYTKVLCTKKSETLDVLNLDSKDLPAKSNQHFLVVDRLQVNKASSGRIFDAIAQAFKVSDQLYAMPVASVLSVDGETKKFKKQISCSECDEVFPKLTPDLFSFNNAVGACENCQGFGNTLNLDKKLVIPNEDLSLNEGAIHPFSMPSGKSDLRELKKFCKKNKIDLSVPWKKLSKQDRDNIWSGQGDWYGVEGLFKYLERKKYKMHVRVFLSRFKSSQHCTVCEGKRLNRMMEQVKVSGLSVSDVCKFSLSELEAWLKGLKLNKNDKILVKEILDQMISRVSFLNEIGLSYLTLLRGTKTLSGGEFQRLNISNQIGTDLTDTLYVLDEPTIGLHPRDNDKLIKKLHQLHKNNNTVVVVEHDPEVIKSADYVIEMGPESGIRGGDVVFKGSQKKFKSSKSQTSKFIYNPLKKGVFKLGDKTINKDKAFEFFGCSGHNLKDVDFSVPLNQISVITGVSGSGKSSLVSQTVYPALLRKLQSKVSGSEELSYKKFKLHKDIKNIDFVSQSRIMKSRRSIVSTYVGLYDHIRKLFANETQARILGFDAGSFSLNTKGGRCPTCKGLGFEEVEMLFMDNIELPCETCGGKKFTNELLSVKYNDKNIKEVLDLTCDEAEDFFSDQLKINRILKSLKSLKLDYLCLGQSLSTLSGGESQRLKLLTHLTSTSLSGSLFVFDEPSTGLHFNEIKALIEVFRRLKEGGATIVIVEHNLDVIASSDWLIDVGPEAGDDGGKLVLEGKPLSVVKKTGYTAEYLKKHLSL